jgi:glycosyltransferase involved in cell wall biosynthesis
MVAVEAMAQGTPVLVPDRGGITETISANGADAGLTFRTWDTASLAEQLEKLLTDDALHTSLSANCVSIARSFGVEAMTDRVLTHMELCANVGKAGRKVCRCACSRCCEVRGV